MRRIAALLALAALAGCGSGGTNPIVSAAWDEMQGFGIPRMVCRNPGCVSHVLINGKLAVDDEQITPELGRQSGFGQFLAAR